MPSLVVLLDWLDLWSNRLNLWFSWALRAGFAKQSFASVFVSELRFGKCCSEATIRFGFFVVLDAVKGVLSSCWTPSLELFFLLDAVVGTLDAVEGSSS